VAIVTVELREPVLERRVFFGVGWVGTKVFAEQQWELFGEGPAWRTWT
jgi:hypothetical protein